MHRKQNEKQLSRAVCIANEAKSGIFVLFAMWKGEKDEGMCNIFFGTAVFALFASEKVLQRALFENAGNVRADKLRAEAETGFLSPENGLRFFALKITRQEKVFFVVALTKDLNFCFHE